MRNIRILCILLYTLNIQAHENIETFKKSITLFQFIKYIHYDYPYIYHKIKSFVEESDYTAMMRILNIAKITIETKPYYESLWNMIIGEKSLLIHACSKSKVLYTWHDKKEKDSCIISLPTLSANGRFLISIVTTKEHFSDKWYHNNSYVEKYDTQKKVCLGSWHIRNAKHLIHMAISNDGKYAAIAFKKKYNQTGTLKVIDLHDSATIDKIKYQGNILFDFDMQSRTLWFRITPTAPSYICAPEWKHITIKNQTILEDLCI